MKTWALVTRYFSCLERLGKSFNFLAGIVCIVALGIADYYIGLDYSLQLFYLVPVFFVSLTAGRNAGIVTSILSTIAWMISNNNIALTLPQVWNGATTLGFLLVCSLMLSKMKAMFEHERAAGRTDHLTGALNSRSFVEVADLHILRLNRTRSPFTIAYLDIDNFKEVNDYHGHSSGDKLLRTVVGTLVANLRRTDVIARLGGDEFCILLADTDDRSAKVVLNKLFENLQETIIPLNWNVTFSIGVLTCFDPPESTDRMISLADKLMYEVKRNGKNSIKFDTYACDAGDLPNNFFAL